MISLVIFGVAGYISSQLIENPGIEIWAIIFFAGLIGALFSLLYFRPRVEPNPRFSFKNLIFGLIPYLVLLPGAVALLLSVRVQLSNNGAFHLGYIHQILNGFAPPENVVLPGYPANVYWLFHAFIATLAEIFNSTPPFVAALVNIGALIISIYWIRKIIYILGLGNKNSFITSCYSLLILFSTNLFGTFNMVLTYILHKGFYSESIFEWVTYKHMMLGGDLRLVSLAKKFFNFNGTPLGIVYFTFALYISIVISKGGLTSKNIILLAIAVSGALMFHVTTGVYVLLIIPLSILISLLLTNKQCIVDYFKNTQIRELLLILLVILILFIPIIHYIYLAASAMPVKTKIGTSIEYNLISILSTVYPLIPLSLFGVYLYYRKKFEIIVYLCVFSSLGYIVAILLDLPSRNQYKFIFVTNLVFSILGVMTLDYLYYELKGTKKYLGRLLFIAFLTVSVSSILISSIKYLASERFSDRSYYYENGLISLREGIKYKDAFEWMRGNTTPETIVILPLPSKNTGYIDRLNGSVYVVTQRLPYVAFGHIYAEGIDEYEYRYDNVIQFYSDSTPIEKKIEILGEFEKFSRKRPSILLIPKGDLKILAPHLENLQLLYSGKDANLYSFKNN